MHKAVLSPLTGTAIPLVLHISHKPRLWGSFWEERTDFEEIQLSDDEIDLHDEQFPEGMSSGVIG